MLRQILPIIHRHVHELEVQPVSRGEFSGRLYALHGNVVAIFKLFLPLQKKHGARR